MTTPAATTPALWRAWLLPLAVSYLAATALFVLVLYLPLMAARDFAFAIIFEACHAWLVFFLTPFIVLEGLAALLMPKSRRRAAY